MTIPTTPPPEVHDFDKFHTHDDPRHARLTTPSEATGAHATPPSPAHSTLDFIDIIDIRRDALGSSLDLGRDIMAQLAPARGPKKMPTLLLYDEKGLQTFEEVRCVVLGWSLVPCPCCRPWAISGVMFNGGGC